MADERYCADCETLLELHENECPKCGCTQKIAYLQIRDVTCFTDSSIEVKLIKYSKQAVKALERLDRPTKKRIEQSILGIPKGDIKPFQGVQGHYRLRVGDWRIIFSFEEDDIVQIKKIGPRGGVYKGV